MIHPGIRGGDLVRLWRPGAILHTRANASFSRTIRWALNKWQLRYEEDHGLTHTNDVWGSHDAICVYQDGEKGFGEMLASQGGVWTSLDEYVGDIESGRVSVRLFWPIWAGPYWGSLAGSAWWSIGYGRTYDYAAFPRLLAKCLVMDLSQSKYKWLRMIGDRAAGWRWAHWCTEDVRSCWMDCADFWMSENPTPLTTEHRAGLVSCLEDNVITLKEVVP